MSMGLPEGFFSRYGLTWKKCKARKPTRCFICRRRINPGDETARPWPEDQRNPAGAKRCDRLCKEHQE